MPREFQQMALAVTISSEGFARTKYQVLQGWRRLRWKKSRRLPADTLPESAPSGDALKVHGIWEFYTFKFET